MILIPTSKFEMITYASFFMYTKFQSFVPNYEKCLKNADSNYERIEEEISKKFGTGGKKGIGARYVALKYQKSNFQAPKPIISLINTILGLKLNRNDANFNLL